MSGVCLDFDNFINLNPPPSPFLKPKEENFVQGTRELKQTFANFKLSDSDGIRSQILENVQTLLGSGVRIDENMLKQINIFRMQTLEIAEVLKRLEEGRKK